VLDDGGNVQRHHGEVDSTGAAVLLALSGSLHDGV
jgi:hypothetical protein